MKQGDLVRFVRNQVADMQAESQKFKQKLYLRQDVIGLVIVKVRHLEDMWIVNFPKLGGQDGYPESWLEVISEAKIKER